MRIQIVKTAPFYFFIVTLSGCSSIYYAPNGHNVPAFREKKEGRVAISGCSTDDGTLTSQAQGVEIQSAYAMSKHLAVVMNAFFVRDGNDEDYNKGRGRLIEGGIGYFKPFQQDKFVFEIYGGFGRGKVLNRYDYGGRVSANLKRFFLQPSIAFTRSHFEMIGSLRFGLLTYNEATFSSSSGQTNEPDISYLDDGNAELLVEPAITIRGGWRWIHGQAQLVLSENLSHSDFPQQHLNVNIGLQIKIHQKEKQ